MVQDGADLKPLRVPVVVEVCEDLLLHPWDVPPLERCGVVSERIARLLHGALGDDVGQVLWVGWNAARQVVTRYGEVPPVGVGLKANRMVGVRRKGLRPCEYLNASAAG